MATSARALEFPDPLPSTLELNVKIIIIVVMDPQTYSNNKSKFGNMLHTHL